MGSLHTGNDSELFLMLSLGPRDLILSPCSQPVAITVKAITCFFGDLPVPFSKFQHPQSALMFTMLLKSDHFLPRPLNPCISPKDTQA